MKSASLAVCFVLLAVSTLPAAPPADGKWRLVFADEFTGSPADLDRLWDFQNGPNGHIKCSRWRENVVLKGGSCLLVSRKENRGGQQWTSASMWTKQEFQYGYFEARYKYAAASGINNSFWLITRSPKGSSGRFEIDINEGHYPDSVNMNLHNWSGKHWAKSKEWKAPGGKLDRQFHTYGFLWTDKDLVWYFDDKEIRRLENTICHGPAPVYFSTAIMDWAGKITDAIDGTAMEVDYVRVYQPLGKYSPPKLQDKPHDKPASKSPSKPASKPDAPKPSAPKPPATPTVSSPGPDAPDGPDFAAMIQPAPPTAKFIDPDYYIWCGTMTRGDDGRCHLYYSRWPRKLGHYAWVTHSEVAHAVADDPLGTFRHKDVALPARGRQFWDGLCTHNPTVLRSGGKFYLYYMGNTGDGQASPKLNFVHRNNQRIGVAVADSPDGPWTRRDEPLVVPTPGFFDALCCTNPAVTQRPGGDWLMVYKAVGDKNKLPFGGPVLHVAATSPGPLGPFTKHPKPVFMKEGVAFAAEDPFIWQQDGRLWAIVKDNAGYFTGQGKSTALFESADGLDWRLTRHPLVATTEVTWSDGRRQKLNSLERPQLFFDAGRPAVLLFAADETGKREHSFNIRLPLKWKGK